MRLSPPISGLSSGSTDSTLANAGLLARRWARKTTSIPISGGSSTGSPSERLRQADWLQVGQSRLMSALTRGGSPSPGRLTEVSQTRSPSSRSVVRRSSCPARSKRLWSSAERSAPTVSRNKWSSISRAFATEGTSGASSRGPGWPSLGRCGTHRLGGAAQLRQVQPFQRLDGWLCACRQPPLLDDGDKRGGCAGTRPPARPSRQDELVEEGGARQRRARRRRRPSRRVFHRAGPWQQVLGRHP